jgi:hypothetical protein
VQRLTDEARGQVEELGVPESAEAREKVSQIVGSWASGLIARGLEVKGLWLVDFDNGSGYYCWRYPEPGLQYYHTYQDGFSGRMRIQ